MESISFRRPQAALLAERVGEARRFLQVVAGPRRVGKTALVQQVCETAAVPVQFASADEPTLRGSEWVAQQIGPGGISLEEFLARPIAAWVGA